MPLSEIALILPDESHQFFFDKRGNFFVSVQNGARNHFFRFPSRINCNAPQLFLFFWYKKTLSKNIVFLRVLLRCT
nr:hypothetical protein [Escherichia coli]